MTSKDKLIKFLKSASIRYVVSEAATKYSYCVKTPSIWYFFDYNGNYTKSL